MGERRVGGGERVESRELEIFWKEDHLESVMGEIMVE